MTANYTSASGAPQTASGPFSWVPKQMLSGDAADEEGESDGDSDRGDEDRGEGDEAELVIDIPNEWKRPGAGMYLTAGRRRGGLLLFV